MCGEDMNKNIDYSNIIKEFKTENEFKELLFIEKVIGVTGVVLGVLVAVILLGQIKV
jgi:hypothetical protein